MRSELFYVKNPQTPAGIEPATFRFVAQHLNHCATAVPKLEEVATENNLSDIPGNMFNIEESGLPVNNKPDILITENGFIKFMF